MADTKISALAAVSSVVTAQEFAVNDAGTTKKATAEEVSEYVESRYQQGVLCSHASDQAIPTATWKELAFDTETWKVGSVAIHSTVTNNSRFTAQVAGEYHVTASVQWEALAIDNPLRVQIFKNGAAELWRDIRNSVNSASVASFVNLSAFVQLSATDYVEIRVYHSRGSDRDVVSTMTRAGMYLIGR